MAEEKPKSPHRRKFLLGGAAAIVGGTAAALHFKPWYRPLGANADVRVGIAGTGNKGIDHINAILDVPGARITAICDPDPNQLEQAFATTKLKRDAVTTYSDFRKLIEDKEADAIVIASPNHWHALMGVWAMQAGKHVYIEKPVSHSIWEGQMLVDAAAKYGLVVQSGTQRRSDLAYSEAAEWLAEGHIGKITSVRAVVYRKRRALTLRKSPTPMPSGVDYDHWCGPAQKEELYRSKLHKDWHWYWNTGNGEIGNNGVHFLDVARIILGESHLPSSVVSAGGRLGWGKDAGETPNSQLAFYDYRIPIIAQIGNLPIRSKIDAPDHHENVREGVVVHCEGGILAWPKAKNSDGKTIKKFDSHDGYGHRVNWLRAIVDNRPQDVNAPISEGHISSAMCHLANASHRAGATLPLDQIQEQFSANPSAKSALEKLAAHLDANEIDVGKTPLTMGSPTSESDATKPEFRASYDFPTV